MDEIILVITLITAAIVIIGLFYKLVIFIKKKEGNKKDVNYQAFYYLGFIWIAIGIVFMITINVAIGIAFMSLAISYIAIGLANRDKWEYKN